MAPTKRKAISFEKKKEILRDWRQGFKVGSLVRKYELSQSTISTILKSGDVVMKKAGSSGFDDQRKRLREALYEDVEEALYQWFLTIRNENMPISGPILAAKAKRFAFLLGRGDFQPGGGWIQRFKERHGIVYRNVLERSEDGFSVVAEYLGKGLFNKVTLLTDGAGAPHSKPGPRNARPPTGSGLPLHVQRDVLLQ
ncbi:hypothetical protein HPB47_026869 [Ixodes persulcatus]|uniref:Uncharacterized protein n=1 Tax=Ixodes persulcatus TaxID=34615 RepID=A0AC60PZ49_IXOPE|nr:hypothetical protein HPB47_026869 [Ixodes persulcatus]